MARDVGGAAAAPGLDHLGHEGAGGAAGGGGADKADQSHEAITRARAKGVKAGGFLSLALSQHPPMLARWIRRGVRISDDFKGRYVPGTLKKALKKRFS